MLLSVLEPVIASAPEWTLHCATIVVLLAILYAVRRVEQWHRISRYGSRAPRFPTKLPLGLDFIARSLRQYGKCQSLMLWEEMLRTSSRTSRTVEVNVGGKQMIVTCDPQNIKAVLSTQFDSFGKGPKFYSDWHEFLGEGIFNTDGQQWSDGRALVRAQFAKDRISDIDIFERHTLQLIPLLIGGETIDIKPLMFGFTLYMATDFLLGKSTGSIHDPDIVVFISARHGVGEPSFHLAPGVTIIS